MIKDRDQFKRQARNQVFSQNHTHDEPNLGDVIDSRKQAYLGQPGERKLFFGHPTFNMIYASIVTGTALGTINGAYQIGLQNCNMNQIAMYKLYRFGQKNPFNYFKLVNKHFFPGFVIGLVATPAYFGWKDFLHKGYFSDQRAMARDIFCLASIFAGVWFCFKGSRNVGKAFIAGVYVGGAKFCMPTGHNYTDPFRSTGGSNIRRGFYEQHQIDEQTRLLYQRKDAIYELAHNENIKNGFRVDL